jgi:hypothetical protein
MGSGGGHEGVRRESGGGQEGDGRSGEVVEGRVDDGTAAIWKPATMEAKCQSRIITSLGFRFFLGFRVFRVWNNRFLGFQGLKFY